MTSKTTNKFSPEVRARAVRMVLDHASEHPSRWAAVTSIAAKIGCTPQTLHDWVKKAEIDSGQRAGVSTDMAEKLKALERENRELRQANEILRKASAYFATVSRLMQTMGLRVRHWLRHPGQLAGLRPCRSDFPAPGQDYRPVGRCPPIVTPRNRRYRLRPNCISRCCPDCSRECDRRCRTLDAHE